MWFLAPRKPRWPNSVPRRPTSCRLRLESLEERCVPSAPGTLDTSFGSGGIVTTSFGNRTYDRGGAVAVQPDGKILEAGFVQGTPGNTDTFAVVRYNPSGALDSTFGNGGEVTTPFPAGSIRGSDGQKLVLQPDGKIVLGGIVNNNIELVRYNANGSLDTTFGGTGEVSTAFPDAPYYLAGVQLETVNGVPEIVAGGDMTLPNGADALFLARCNPNGGLDPTFGTGGESVTSNLGQGDIYSLAIQADGNIVAAGDDPTLSHFFVERFDLAGNLDQTFGTGGVVVGPMSGTAWAVIVQPDGEIVAGGRTYANSLWHWSLERLNSDGSLDSTFGTGGLVVGPSGFFVRALALQADGKIVAAGSPYAGATDFKTAAFDLARFNADGSLDTAFGTSGLVITSVNGGGDSEAVALQSDGKIIAAGSGSIVTKKATLSVFALARYWGDSVPAIGSFTASPNPVTSGSSITLTASNITDANPSSTITQVAFYLASSSGNGQLNSNDTLLGYAVQTSPGVWTLTFTVTLTPGTYTIFAQAEDNLGVFSYADALTLTVQ